MKSLLFCITRTSIPCASIALRMAVQRRSSSWVEIGALRRSDSLAMLVSLRRVRPSLAAGGFTRKRRRPAQDDERIERGRTFIRGAERQRVDLHLCELGIGEHQSAETLRHARSSRDVRGRRAAHAREELGGAKLAQL